MYLEVRVQKGEYLSKRLVIYTKIYTESLNVCTMYIMQTICTTKLRTTMCTEYRLLPEIYQPNSIILPSYINRIWTNYLKKKKGKRSCNDITFFFLTSGLCITKDVYKGWQK